MITNNKLKKLNNVLLFILLFFGLFDVARSYTKLPIAFGYLKDITIYILVIINISRLYLPKNLGKGFYLWAFAVIAFSLLGFFNSNYSVKSIAIAWFKFSEIFLLILLFFNWDRIFLINFDNFIKFYIGGSLLLCFVNIFGYFVDNPIVSVNMPNANMPAGHYGGRITVGQPPLAIFPVLLSFIYLMIYAEDFKNRLLCGIFLVCIILSTSNTGIISVAAVCLLLLVLALLNPSMKNVKKNLLFIIGFSCMVFVLAYCVAHDFTVSMLERYFNKLGQYLYGASDPSMDIRHVHWQTGLSSMQPLDCLIGRGAYGYITDELYPIENTFIITFLMYGIVGLVGMIGFFIHQLFRSVLLFHKHKTKKSLLWFCILITFLFHLYTLDLYLCYTMFFSLALFAAYCNYQNRRHEFGRRLINDSHPDLQSGEFSVKVA